MPKLRSQVHSPPESKVQRDGFLLNIRPYTSDAGSSNLELNWNLQLQFLIHLVYIKFSQGCSREHAVRVPCQVQLGDLKTARTHTYKQDTVC